MRTGVGGGSLSPRTKKAMTSQAEVPSSWSMARTRAFHHVFSVSSTASAARSQVAVVVPSCCLSSEMRSPESKPSEVSRSISYSTVRPSGSTDSV